MGGTRGDKPLLPYSPPHSTLHPIFETRLQNCNLTPINFYAIIHHPTEGVPE